MSALLKILGISLLIIVLRTLPGSAQEIIAKGFLVDRSNKNRVVLAEITNLRNGFAVGSNDLGYFQIRANPGDTLIISKRNYAEAKMIVKDEKEVVTYLLPTLTTIESVTITGSTKKGELDAIRRDFKNSGSFYQGKPPILAFIFSPLTAMYELFGRTPRNARRFGRYYDNELKQSGIDVFYNKTLISENTDLAGDELSKFMMNYRPPYEKAQNWNNYDAIKYIKESYKHYQDTLKVKK